MRILQLLRAPVGGLFRHVCDLTEELAKRGHEIGVVVDSLSNDAQTETKLAALAEHTALGIHRFPMPRLFGTSDLTTPFAIRKLTKSLNIDVLHGHGAKGGFYARLARYGGGKARAIYTPHGGVLHYSKTSKAGRVFHALERHLMAQTQSIIFESAFAQRSYTELIGNPTCPTEIIYNGLRASEFDKVTPVTDAAEFVFVGELRELKGIFELVDALAQVSSEQSIKPRLVMAGDGPCRGELEARLSLLGLNDQVKLLGSRPAREVFALGKCAILPSRAESLPYIVLEATAAGLPVITTDVGGIPEIFGPTAARLIPAQDTERLQRAIKNHLSDPTIEIEASRLRYEYIREKFSVDQMADRVLNTYQPHI